VRNTGGRDDQSPSTHFLFFIAYGESSSAFQHKVELVGGFMRVGSTRAHLLLLSAVAVLLGLLLFIVYWLDHPFGNQLGVTSEPFEQSLSVFDSIDRGT